MRKNYTIKTITKGLAIFAITLSASFATGQTAIDGVSVLRSLATTDYPDGTANIISNQVVEVTVEGGVKVSFKLQAVVTPTGNATFVGTTTQPYWGVGTSTNSENPKTTFDGNHNDAATITTISVVDFNANGTGYTESAISNLHFDGITIRGADNHNADSPLITVNGATPGPFTLGKLADPNQEIDFGVAFNNLAGDSFTIGGTADVTSITLACATTNWKNIYQIIGTDVNYTFTTLTTLSTENITKDDTTLVISPSVVESTFTVNKEFKTLKIIDISGRTVKSFSTSDVLEVSGLGSGVYIVKLESEDGGLATKRLIVK